VDSVVISKLLATFSELFVNLSAGWLGAAIIVVQVVSRNKKLNRNLLTFNIINGILALFLSFLLKLI